MYVSLLGGIHKIRVRVGGVGGVKPKPRKRIRLDTGGGGCTGGGGDRWGRVVSPVGRERVV